MQASANLRNGSATNPLHLLELKRDPWPWLAPVCTSLQGAVILYAMATFVEYLYKRRGEVVLLMLVFSCIYMIYIGFYEFLKIRHKICFFLGNVSVSAVLSKLRRIDMKLRSLVLSMAIAAPFAANAALDLSGLGYFTYGNTNTYSMPLSALDYQANNGGPSGPGNPYYIVSTPGAIKDTAVIYTGSGGTDVTTNIAGIDDAYGTPNGKQNPYAYMGTVAGGENIVAPSLKTGIANQSASSWDANLLALKGFLDGGNAVFLFNNNDTNADQTLAIWARVWITDGSGNYAAGTRSLYLTNRGLAYDSGILGGSAGGVEGGDATAYNGGNVVDPLAPSTKDNTDFVRAGGDVDSIYGTVNHNLGANQVAYAGVMPLLDQWFAGLFLNTDAVLSTFTMHLDLRLGCKASEWTGDQPCDDTAIDNGFEQLFLASSSSTFINVPEPAGLALFGVALVGLAASRRRGGKSSTSV